MSSKDTPVESSVVSAGPEPASPLPLTLIRRSFDGDEDFLCQWANGGDISCIEHENDASAIVHRVNNWDAALAQITALKEQLAAGCTCGSGAHPRRCKRHPGSYEHHVFSLNFEQYSGELENAEQERDSLKARVKELETDVTRVTDERDRALGERVRQKGLAELADKYSYQNQIKADRLAARIEKLECELVDRGLRCDGNHHAPACYDVECWHRNNEKADLRSEIERLRALLPPTVERNPGYVGQGDWSVFAEEVVRQRDELKECLEKLQRAGEGHDKLCYYCSEKCNSFAGNPGKWPIHLCHADDPGVVKWHHVDCVSNRLRELEQLKNDINDKSERTV